MWVYRAWTRRYRLFFILPFIAKVRSFEREYHRGVSVQFPVCWSKIGTYRCDLSTSSRMIEIFHHHNRIQLRNHCCVCVSWRFESGYYDFVNGCARERCRGRAIPGPISFIQKAVCASLLIHRFQPARSLFLPDLHRKWKSDIPVQVALSHKHFILKKWKILYRMWTTSNTHTGWDPRSLGFRRALTHTKIMQINRVGLEK